MTRRSASSRLATCLRVLTVTGATLLVGQGRATSAFATSGDVVADLVLGQPDFSHDGNNIVTGQGIQPLSGIPGAGQLAVDRSVSPNRVYLADTGNNRVLGWSTTTAFVSGQPASIVLGQPDFTRSECNDGTAAGDVAGVGPDSLCQPAAVAVDSSGTVYVSDTNNNRVLRYTQPFGACPSLPCVAGPADLVLGQGAAGTGFTSNGNSCSGLGVTNQTLCGPIGLALDSHGNVYVADSGDNRVLVYDAPLVAGSLGADQVFGQGAAGNAFDQSSANGPGGANLDASHLSGPSGVALDSHDDVYVIDRVNIRVLEYGEGNLGTPTNFTANRVFGVDATGTSFNVQGNGCNVADPTGVRFCIPQQVAVDSHDAVYVADAAKNHVLVFNEPAQPPTNVTPNFVIGQGAAGNAFGSGTCDNGDNGTPPPSSSHICSPTGVAVDDAGTVYVAENSRILGFPEATNPPTNAVASVVLGQTDFSHIGGNIVKRQGMTSPYVAVDAVRGHVYVLDSDNNRVLGWYDSAGLVNGQPAALVIGQPDFVSYACNDGTAPGDVKGLGLDSLCGPLGVAVDPQGNLWVSDTNNSRVLEYDVPFASCSSSCVGAPANRSFGQSGPTNANTLNAPIGIAIDSFGNLYVADAFSNRVLEFNDPIVSGHTTADLVIGQPDFTSDTCAATPGPDTICFPLGLAVDAQNNLYVADGGNSRVLEFTEAANPPINKTANLVFGQGAAGNDFASTSCGSGAAALCLPIAIAVDANNHVYIADGNTPRVLAYSQCGAIPTNVTADLVLGQGASGTNFSGMTMSDGVGGDPFPSATGFAGLFALSVDASGSLYVADVSRVLRFDQPSVPPTTCPSPTPALSPTPTPTPVPTATPTMTPAATSTPTAVPTPTVAPSATPAPTATPTPAPSQSPAPTPTPSMTPTPTPSATPTPPLDAFQCYKVSKARAPHGHAPFPEFSAQTGVVVEDALSSTAPGDQHEVDLKAAALLCNPADVNQHDPSVPSHPTHLEAYKAKLSLTTPAQPKPVKSVRTVQNQLGTLKLRVSKVASVLAPTADALGSDGAPPLGSTLVDHFKCYSATVAKAPHGQPPFPTFTKQTIILTDQLGGPLQYDLSKPRELCLPADESGQDPTAPTHPDHLVCYKAKLTRTLPAQPKFHSTTVSTENSFGDEVLSARGVAELCLPSLRLD